MRLEARSNALELSLWLLRWLNLSDLALYFIITHWLLLYIWWLNFDWHVNFIIAGRIRYDRLTLWFLHTNLLASLINKESITFEMSLGCLLWFVIIRARCKDIWRHVFRFDCSERRLFVCNGLSLIQGAARAIRTWVLFTIYQRWVECRRYLLEPFTRINTFVPISLKVDSFHSREVGTLCLVCMWHTVRCHQRLRSCFPYFLPSNRSLFRCIG